jgi:hypothetical protein
MVDLKSRSIVIRMGEAATDGANATLVNLHLIPLGTRDAVVVAVVLVKLAGTDALSVLPVLLAPMLPSPLWVGLGPCGPTLFRPHAVVLDPA